MSPGPRGPRVPWTLGLEQTALLLAGGSFVFLGNWLWGLAAQFRAGIAAFFFVANAIGIGFHFASWWRLVEFLDEAGTIARPTLRASVGFAFVGTVLGFGIGFATLPTVFPTSPSGTSAWRDVLRYAFFPYVPSVFGPAAIGQGAMFLLAARGMSDRIAALGVRVSSSALLGLAVGGLILQGVLGPQVFPLPSNPVWSISGLTALPFLGIGLSWRREAVSRGKPAEFSDSDAPPGG